MEECKISNLYSLDETIAKDLLIKYTYPWEVLPHIEKFILELGKKLPKEEYNQIGEDVWIHKTAKVFESAYIHGPAIICKDAEIRHCAFIREKAIVGEGAVVGNSTELKNVILFNKVQVPHYNYVGDSIIGYKSHLGAGAITSNVKSDKKLIVIKNGKEKKEILNKISIMKKYKLTKEVKFALWESKLIYVLWYTAPNSILMFFFNIIHHKWRKR